MKEIKKIKLEELFNISSTSLLKAMNNKEINLLEDEGLPDEFWAELLGLINSSYTEFESEWEKDLRQLKLKILCNKYFTKRELLSLDSLETDIRKEVKKYYSSLESYVSLKNFKERFFSLPYDLLTSFCRYIFYFSEELNKKIGIDKKELQTKIKELKEERKSVIQKIAFISNNNPSILDLTNIKELLEFGVFYEDNFLNRGLNEYLHKILSHNVSRENIKETFGNTFYRDMLELVEKNNAFISHLKSIKNDTGQDFFDKSGGQLGRRFDLEIEVVEKKEYSNYIVQKDTVFKEPNEKINFEFSNDIPAAKEVESTKDSVDLPSGSSGDGVDISSDEIDPSTIEDDGTEMPETEEGIPTDFGTVEDNTQEDEDLV